ncbi:Ig-like domain-containing protein [Actinoplanes oblitus]|uniref:Ig-like domain-containing protein n=1 Tax=Actinoplanes oblitus TaxID=3040509 RepID=A0ABY8WEU8_9ACTN|nr:Ig-like domain-containing protein [Actinoplanes oblitus]WIM96384.1 Ig-like domain-containing protein [Actinoplanes oblitus]
MASAALAAPAHAATGPVLRAGAAQQLSAAPGGDFEVALSVTNTGATALTGVGVALYTLRGFEPTEQFANCAYEQGAPTLCTFDRTLEPGKSYRVVLPYRVRADTYAPGSLNGQFEWLTADQVAGHEGGAAGVGDVLPLQEAEQPGDRADDSLQTIDVTVTGANGADLVAIGDAVSGAVGDQVPATVGVRNDGPASLDGGRGGWSPAEVEVALPAGTSVVSAPDECGRGDDAAHYVCASPSLLTAGTTATWTLTLKINKVVADARGTVVVNPPCQCQRLDDLDRSNDAALLTANPIPDGGVDQAKPVVVHTGLLDGQRVPANLVFHPAAADNVGVTELAASVNGSLPASCTVRSGCEASLASLPSDTDATVTVRATDAAGNYAEKAVKVHVDNVVPTATFAPAAGSSVYSGPVTITLSGVAGDVWRVDAIDGSGVHHLPDASRTYTWNATSGAASPRFVLTDLAGNTATLATDYVVVDKPVDSTAPVIARVDFAGAYSTNRLDTGAGWLGAVSTLKPTIQDESPIVRTEWSVNGVLKSSSPAFAWDARAFPAATATVRLQVWDAAGNTSTRSFPVSIDKTAPTMTVTPGQHALIRGATYVTSLRAADAHGVAVTNLKGRSGPVTSVRLSSGPDGTKTITWVAVDKLGNSASVTRTVIVDNTAPTLALTKAPKNRSKLTKKVTIAASASDRNRVAKVQLLVNGKVVATDSTAGYRFVLNPAKYGKKFTVRLRAYDKAGNVRYSAGRAYRR